MPLSLPLHRDIDDHLHCEALELLVGTDEVLAATVGLLWGACEELLINMTSSLDMRVSLVAKCIQHVPLTWEGEGL